MEDRLRSMGVNMDQRKRLMAAGRFGIGPLVSMGMVDQKAAASALALPGPPGMITSPPPAHITVEAQAALAAAAEREQRRRAAETAPLSGGSSGSSSRAHRADSGARVVDQEQRRQAWRKLHEEDGLQDVQAFLAPKKAGREKDRNPIREKEGVPKASAPQEVAAASKMALKITSGTANRATASSAGARAKAASFKAIQGPTAEELWQFHLVQKVAPQAEPARREPLGAARNFAEDAVDLEPQDEELRRAKREAKKQREEWRKAWKEEKKRKQEEAKKAAEINEEESEESNASSHGGFKELEKHRQLLTGKDGQASSVKAMDQEQRRFWGESVKGRMSQDYKGFTDADLEQRFRQQQQATAGQNLMTEAQVLAMLKGTDAKEKTKVKEKEKEKEKEKGKEKAKKKDKDKEKEKAKDKGSRSRSRSRDWRASSRSRSRSWDRRAGSRSRSRSRSRDRRR